MDRFYITTPIYYVNDKPHIGHAYTTILADVLARYHRLLGVPVHFLTGTDEHGQKVWEAARKAGVSPQEQCDRMVVRFQRLWERLGITHDDFIRTTEPRHTEVVQEILADLHERGEIYRDEYEGWYSVSEERFYTEKELVDGRSPEGKPVEKIRESNWFFRMSRHQQWLVDWIESHPEFIQPEQRRNETLGFLRQPLGDLCISRPKARMPWGIELPFDRDYVCYVWFDALVNYISAIGYRRDEETFRRWWPADMHLIGKDILTTHTVYWPTMLHAMGLEPPRTIFAHGWWLSGGAKMSKSEGNVTDPMEMADRHGVDALRYYLMADMTLGQDAVFTEEAFALRYNADLANDLGNLASRVLRLVERHCDGRVPAPDDAGSGAAEAALREAVAGAVVEMEQRLQAMQLDRGLAAVIGAVRETNRYVDQCAPWSLARSGETARLGTVLYHALEALRIVSGLLHPVMPGRMAELRRALGLAEDEVEPHLDRLRTWGGLEAGRPAAAPPSLFPRIDRRRTAAAGAARGTAKPAGAAKKGGKPAAGTISFRDFSRFVLRTARVLEAARVEGADRLLRLVVDLGDERRQLVAGIAAAYAPEDLVGRTIVVVANLEPATIRGVRSEGMLLAAQHGDTLSVITVAGDVPPGTPVS
ncbi:MAG: methionine--tRNA ligase [Acidobacteria bacterium]|nr:MAG: methionine--tRNA ligase [Acidobacteriota bacterium]